MRHVDAQIRLPEKALAHQAIYVRVGSSLPRAVLVTEVNGNGGLLAKLLVHGHLSALVVHLALAH